MSLNKLMNSLTEDLFLSKDGFAEEVLFYPGGDPEAVQKVMVVWDADNVPGSNEVDGDGRVLDKRSGKRVRQSIMIECSTDLVVNENADTPDRFVRGTEVAAVKRVMGYDSGGMQTILCVRSDVLYDRGLFRMG